jgi:hypothetical protein
MPLKELFTSSSQNRPDRPRALRPPPFCPFYLSAYHPRRSLIAVRSLAPPFATCWPAPPSSCRPAPSLISLRPRPEGLVPSASSLHPMHISFRLSLVQPATSSAPTPSRPLPIGVSSRKYRALLVLPNCPPSAVSNSCASGVLARSTIHLGRTATDSPLPSSPGRGSSRFHASCTPLSQPRACSTRPCPPPIVPSASSPPEDPPLADSPPRLFAPGRNVVSGGKRMVEVSVFSPGRVP